MGTTEASQRTASTNPTKPAWRRVKFWIGLVEVLVGAAFTVASGYAILLDYSLSGLFGCVYFVLAALFVVCGLLLMFGGEGAAWIGQLLVGAFLVYVLGFLVAKWLNAPEQRRETAPILSASAERGNADAGGGSVRQVPAAVEVVVSSDGRVLRARRPGQASFTEFAVLEQCGDPPIVGEPRIRHHRVAGNSVVVTFGKHCSATAHLDTGKLTCTGCD